MSKMRWPLFCRAENLIMTEKLPSDLLFIDEDILFEWMPFEEAREFVRGLGLKSMTGFRKYIESGSLPINIPRSPRTVYEEEWESAGDWLGTFRIADQYKKFWPYEKARKFVRSLHLKSQKEFSKRCKSGEIPLEIPRGAFSVYSRLGSDFSWCDFLGTNNRLQDWRTFKEARKFSRSLKLKSYKEWAKFCKTDRKPTDIPSSPDAVSKYKTQWVSWDDWLGNGYVAHKFRKYQTFKEARIFARKLGLKNHQEWLLFLKTNKRPRNIPSAPDNYYKMSGWISWGDWLKTDNEYKHHPLYLTFEESKRFVKPLKFQSGYSWTEYRRLHKIRNIPFNPKTKYKSEWISWEDWLGKTIDIPVSI